MRTRWIGSLAIATVGFGVAVGAAARGHGHSHGESDHVHATVPPAYANVSAPANVWTDAQVLARGRAIYTAKCAACHGEAGRGDGPAAAGMALKPASFRDSQMVAAMTDAYWFWRVSEGGRVEPYASKGSAMPPYKDDLSVDDRWAVIAYQHSLSGHAGPHTAAEHPEMQPAPSAQPHGGHGH
jgi:mono/diheme cytochrome c family protein